MSSVALCEIPPVPGGVSEVPPSGWDFEVEATVRTRIRVDDPNLDRARRSATSQVAHNPDSCEWVMVVRPGVRIVSVTPAVPDAFPASEEGASSDTCPEAT